MVHREIDNTTLMLMVTELNSYRMCMSVVGWRIRVKRALALFVSKQWY